MGFWKDRQMTIFDVRITDVTAKSYQDGTTTANLQKVIIDIDEAKIK